MHIFVRGRENLTPYRISYYYFQRIHSNFTQISLLVKYFNIHFFFRICDVTTQPVPYCSITYIRCMTSYQIISLD